MIYSFSKLISDRRLLFRICFVIAAMLLLLLSPVAALKGASYGLMLWYRTLFPTLMPFMVLSNFIVYTGCARPLGALLKPITKLLKLPLSAGYCIICGFLCGYPMGAYVCGSLNEVGELDDETAAFLAPICNNVSPMFMISYICISCLGDKALAKTVIISLMLPAFIAMFVTRFVYIKLMKKKKSTDNILNTPNSLADSAPGNNKNMSDNVKLMATSDALSLSVESALMASLKLCIYVMLFSIAGAMVDNISFLPEIIKAAVMSIMEITAGLDKISKLDISLNYKLFMMLTFTSFGGLSSIFQTMSLWRGRKFYIRKYILYKLIVTSVTILFLLLVTVSGIL